MKKMFNAVVSIMLSMLIICPNNMKINKAYAANKELTGQQIANYCNGRVGQSYASNSCLAFVRESFMALGAERSSDCCAWNYGNKFCTHSSRNDIPIGADVFFTSVGCAYDVIEKGTGHHCGHIGIYVGDGYIVHAYSSKIQKMKIDTVVSHGYTYRGWGIHGNVTLSDVPLDTEMSISGETAPSGNLKQGENFGIYGTIYSNLIIEKLWGGIYQQGTDTAIQYVEESPKSTSYNLHGKFNNNLIFDNLAAGSYTYKIYAKDSKKTYTLISSDFSIGNTISSSMSISGETKPEGNLPKGKFFAIKGYISSSLKISSVWGGVYYDDWTVTSQYAEASPNTTTYDLSKYFDNKIVFNGLAEGSYHYLIKAKDTSGKEYTLISSDFSIGTPEKSHTESTPATTTTKATTTTTTKKTTTKATTTTTTKKTTTKATTATATKKTTAEATTTTIEIELNVSESVIYVKVGEKYSIKANQNDLTFVSSNEDTVVVSNKGIITGIKNGQAVVTVINKSKDTDSIIVNVIVPKYGDSNDDGEVNMSDAVLIMQSLANPGMYGITGTAKNHISRKGYINADCCHTGDGVTNADALSIQKFMLSIIQYLPE